MMDLDELERDALTELLNMGVSRAATFLSKMVSDQVALSVPLVSIVERETAIEAFSRGGPTQFVAVGQSFQGRFSGRALLIFPEVNSLELVRAAVGDGYSLEEIVDLEQEALTEMGNVILNGCLSMIANALRESLSISLPSLLRGDGRTILYSHGDAEVPSDHVLLLYIDFSIRSRAIRGYIALLMDLPSLTALRELIHRFIAGMVPEAGHDKSPR
ncbi:chemotaxis protein CheX [Azospirillum sp. TSO22-1]|uniref:chemotaxis protein CheX n=1 Tax=Azospirillum sp. TSO22-1 TaxID=716789 RepID=UPI000D604612|nr:chemotaxis protein CheX [Azospirillum sp. TSO22-1]PWC56336.1 chemotaxis protein CheX [Azospirillum sp. TSO22-1]